MILNSKNLSYTIITTLFLSISLLTHAQNLAKVNFRISAESATINTVVFQLGELYLRIDQNGEFSLLNKEVKGKTPWSDYSDDEYYDEYAGEGIKGKAKSVGGFKVDYYDKYAGEDRIGKIKSLDAVKFDYYDKYAGEEKKGKIKSIGSLKVDYNDKYAGEEKKGKMKLFGDYRIEYYDKYAGNEKQGKLKSVGEVKIDYHDKYSKPAARIGKIKSIKGNTPQLYVTIDGRNKMSDFND